MTKIIDKLIPEARENVKKLNYPQELIDKVNNAWLTKKFPEQFEGLTDVERVHAFMLLSNREKEQTSLRDEIFKVFVEIM